MTPSPSKWISTLSLLGIFSAQQALPQTAPNWGTSYFGQMVTLGGSGPAGGVNFGPGATWQTASSSGGFAGDNGPGWQAQLDLPTGTARDSAGNIYIADTGNCRLRRILAANGFINTLVNDPSNTYGLCDPMGIAVTTSGTVYFPGTRRNVIWSVPLSGGTPVVAAGSLDSPFSPNVPNSFNQPTDVKLDSLGNLYVVDGRQIKAPGQGIYGAQTSGSTLDGINANLASLGTISALYVNGAGDLYFGDTLTCRARVINHATTIVTTVAGNGTCGFSGDGGAATAAGLAGPIALTLDGAGNILLSEGGFSAGNQRIRRVTASNGIIRTVGGPAAGFTGEGGPALGAGLLNPWGFAADAAGNLYFADTGNNRIRFVSFTAPAVNAVSFWGAAPGGINLVAGGGPSGVYGGDGMPGLGASGISALTYGIAVNKAGDIYFTDSINRVVRKISGVDGTITTVFGTGNSGTSASGGIPTAINVDSPRGLVIDGAGNLYVSDFTTGVIWKVSGNTATTVSMTGSAISPAGIDLDSAGNLYIADPARARIYKVTTAGVTTTVVGGGSSLNDGGLAAAAFLTAPTDVKVDSFGNLIINDGGPAARIRMVTAASGIINTIAGNGTSGDTNDGKPASGALISSTSGGLTLDAGNNIYFLQADVNRPNDTRVRRIDAVTGLISSVAGPGSQVAQSEGRYIGDGGLGTDAVLNIGVAGVGIDQAGNVLFGNGGRIRIINEQPPFFYLPISSAAVGSPAGSGSFTLLGTSALAPWTATSDAVWLTVITASGLGGQAVNYSFAVNTTASPRVGGITVAGLVFIVTQAAGPATYLLTTAASPVAGGVVTPVSGQFAASSTVPVTAAPNPGYLFANWSGPVASANAASTTVVMTGAQTVTANFAVAPPLLSVALSHTGLVYQGQVGATSTIVISNGLLAGPTGGTITVTETVPTGLTLVSMVGMGWTCSGNVCTTTNVLLTGNVGSSIAVVFNVAANAPASLTNQVTVSGGSSPSVSASDVTAIASGITVVSLSPAASTGSNQTYTIQIADPLGASTLTVLNLLVNTALDGRQACYIAYVPQTNTVLLVNDAGAAGGPYAGNLVLNGSSGVSNSQCAVNGAGSSMVSNGNTMTLTLNLAFTPAFSGNKVVFAAARDSAGNNTGWQTLGVHGSTTVVSTFPNPVSVSPASGATVNPTLAFTYQDAITAGNLQTAWALINTALDGRGACYVAYYRPGNQLFLIPDNGDGTQATSIVLAGTNTISNSQCTISAQGSSVSVNGAQLTVNLNIAFKPAFTGPKAVWTAVQTMGGAQTSAWQALGAWLVP